MQAYAERNPFLRLTFATLAIAGAAAVLGLAIARVGMPVVLALAAGPPALAFVAWCLHRPVVGIMTSYLIGFFIGGIGRIIPSVPVGTLVDGLLVLSLVGALLNARKNDVAWLNTPLVYLLLLWVAYTIFELANPEGRSEPWFYGVRNFSIYWVLVTLAGLLTLRKLYYLDWFVNAWLICAAILALWAFKQQYLGLSSFDQRWWDSFGRLTHFINGHMRSFSFCSDAGQYGAVMAHATLYALIRAIDEKRLRPRLFYGALTALYFWGFAVAGSRGPLFILASGFAIYLILRRNIVLFVVGGLAAGGAFGLLKYTRVGQGNYQIQRMRSGLDTDDPSFQLRLANQRAFAEYMASRPIGGGIGMAGDRGRGFGMESELTKRGIDSWYVKVWVETGAVGLTIHVAVLLFAALMGCWRADRLRHPRIRSTFVGLVCGYIGILCASYGNMIFAQFPLNLLMYVTIVFFALSSEFDRQAMEQEGGEGRKEKGKRNMHHEFTPHP